MAMKTLLVVLTVIFLAFGENEVAKENKAKKAMEAEKDRSRSANPGRERGSMHKLTVLMNSNKTELERRQNRRRGKDSLAQIHEMNRGYDYNNMLNDNEGALTTNSKVQNETLFTKMSRLRPKGPTFEVQSKNNYASHATGVFCDFENEASDNCKWEWNKTISKYNLGFRVSTPADIKAMNASKVLQFMGPPTDADGNVGGHFLYLPVDPTMENMVIKSPPFRRLWEFCKFEVQLHQSRMQNASIKLVSESTETDVLVILQEVTGDNFRLWSPVRFMVGKRSQEVRIIVEITRPAFVNLSEPLPHIAIDNLRMIECLPEPVPNGNGSCVPGQIKCKIMRIDSCINLSRVCDLVKDCDDGSDENMNCDKMPYGSYCNFEQDACGFENIPQPILKWSRHSGPTPTDKTGPDYDHTCGPPVPRSPHIIPERGLIPAHINLTLNSCVGYYFFVNMNVTGPNKQRADFASTAVMRTMVFNPPPQVHSNMSSKYYNCCMIRFYYQQNGRNYGSLSVEVVELTRDGNISTSLMFSTKDKGKNWYRAAIFLPNITRSYYLQFKTRMGMRIYSDSAIDDFSMAPECFGLNIDPEELGDYNYYDPVVEEQTTPHPGFADKVAYRFGTCGASGRFGPNQTMCEAAYNNTPVSVSVMTGPHAQGIQVWEVPAEGLYTIIAVGASGGLGSGWAGVSHGASARALLSLHRAELIYMLVGQQGTNACKKTLSAAEGQECSSRRENESGIFTSKTHEVRNTHVTDGGGGGGGATYVFVLDKKGEAHPLLVAGGGGGISVGIFKDDGSQHARGMTNATPETGYMYGIPGKTPGAGGGWVPRQGPTTPGFELIRGQSVKEGGRGGAACNGGAHGGFGGGGGGCLRGGAGGGWLGGNSNQGEGQHGGGGWSYIDTSRAIRDYTELGVASRTGPGEVIIIPAVHDCGCDYRCVALNEHRSLVRCYCPATWTTDAHDPTKCILSDSWPRISWMVIIVLSVAVLVCAIAILCVCLYLYNSYQRKKEEELRQKQIIEQEVQLHRLRAAPGGHDNHLNMAFNPHYGSEGYLPQGVDVRELPQVTRESLKLVKALGKGAFGEVYQGLYRHGNNDTADLPVAVKTLPELSTLQAEHDFLMEAAIMAKFNHSNVVHMIGVCFDRHPRKEEPSSELVEEDQASSVENGEDVTEETAKEEPSSELVKEDQASSVEIGEDVTEETDPPDGKEETEEDELVLPKNFIVLELLAGGDLKNFLRESRPKPERASALTMKDLLLCSLDIGRGCRYLESKRFIHRDIAARNCLLTSRGPGRVVKIADFGMARDIYRADYYKKGGKAMLPIKWMPPEAYIDGVFTIKTDVWSFGVLLWEVFSLGVMPYTGCSNREVMEMVSGGGRLERPTGIPMDIYRLMCECWAPAPGDRPSFAHLYDRINMFIQDPAIINTQLPIVRSHLPLPLGVTFPNGHQRGGVTDYLVPMSPQDCALDHSVTVPLVVHSRYQTVAMDPEEIEDSQYQHLLKVSQEYGNIPMGRASEGKSAASAANAEIRIVTKFLPSNSTDRLLSSVDGTSLDDDTASESDIPESEHPIIWETSFTERPERKVERPVDTGPAVDKLISITPTSPKPPENALSKAIDSNVIDKTNHKNTLVPERKSAPIASPDPPRITAWKEAPKINPKPKPLCLDAAQLEQNLNALKKNSGSVNLNTMNILPPYINVVTPNKLAEAKTIQIDPKKAVIDDLPKEKEKEPEKPKLKQSNSAASLLNGPMTDVPYADTSDAASTSSGSNQNVNSQKNKYGEVVVGKERNKVNKQGSTGEFAESEISC